MVREALTSETLASLEPRDAAARFIARRAEGLTSSEQQLLADWLAKDEMHRQAFDSADLAWQSFDSADGDEILGAMRAHARAPRARSTWQWRPVAAIAAVLLLTVSVALVLKPALNPWAPRHDPATAQPIQYASARGEVKELQLPDGSHMTLDADSVAVGRFGSGGRSVELRRGRAYFEVMPDRSRPFAVAASGRQVVAVGTRFDVDLAIDGLTVTLLEGHVRIGSTDGSMTPLMLEPGQQYVERKGRAIIDGSGAASDNAISWRTGLVSFNERTLAEAAGIMNRYSAEQIVITDPAVASLRISGQFPARETQRFVDTLADVHKLRAVRHGNQIELVRQK